MFLQSGATLIMFLQFTIQCESPISMIQENVIENHKTMSVIKATIEILSAFFIGD